MWFLCRWLNTDFFLYCLCWLWHCEQDSLGLPFANRFYPFVPAKDWFGCIEWKTQGIGNPVRNRLLHSMSQGENAVKEMFENTESLGKTQFMLLCCCSALLCCAGFAQVDLHHSLLLNIQKLGAGQRRRRLVNMTKTPEDSLRLLDMMRSLREQDSQVLISLLSLLPLSKHNPLAFSPTFPLFL